MTFSRDTLDRIIAEAGLQQPLDGDEVDDLVETLRDELNAYQGNDSDDDYEEESPSPMMAIGFDIMPAIYVVYDFFKGVL